MVSVHRIMSGAQPMRIEDILETYHARPLRPFDMNLADGRAVEVEHPDFLLIGPQPPTSERPKFGTTDIALSIGSDPKAWQEC